VAKRKLQSLPRVSREAGGERPSLRACTAMGSCCR
jgi:hypothetical protein